MTSTRAALTPSSAHGALRQACQDVGLDPQGATLLRMGENAIYRTADDIVVRIGRSQDASEKEVRVANWLADAKFPSVRLARLPQAVVAHGFTVTFWETIHESAPEPSSADLAFILRKLHELPSAETLRLPSFRPLPKVRQRLRELPEGALPVGDMDFLLSRCEGLEEDFRELSFDLPLGVIHGDAHPGNLMRRQDSSVCLIDFEDFSWGPREWDLAVTATRYQGFGWVSRSEYDEFVEVYGFDALKWTGYPTIRAIRELNMATWLMQQNGQSRRVDAEIRKRIADLRNNQFPRSWQVF
ncbi:phosphotransferase enzyme family protein [Amycolatopsis sp. NPDC059090]|uniref:phosphotransferase enzyme family protein n=1 Tax=unclassified Amycolatopsis TaxID=2618356 RepID=UPI00366E8389